MIRLFAAGWLIVFHGSAAASEPIRLANHPALSPDGKILAFDWNGDIWTVPVTGGTARALTQHPARDREPKFSPDGKDIAFVSDRDGSPQIYAMTADGGVPRQVTFHTAGYSLLDYAGPTQLLATANRDHFWKHAERFYLVNAKQRSAEELLFDDYGSHGHLSPDGSKLLFVREGTQWWRKGYFGSQASQIWLLDRRESRFTRLLDHPRGCTHPLWKPDGLGFYYVGAQDGTFNLREFTLSSGSDRQLTRFPDDSVVQPCLSRDGSTLVFRHLFDFYRMKADGSEPPTKIDIRVADDRRPERHERKTLKQANAVAFTSDGLEVAFISGGDLWVMDTELREPKAVTRTPGEESSPIFDPDNNALYFVRDHEGHADVWKAERADAGKYWWQNDEFSLTKITDTPEPESRMSFSPDGKKMAYLSGRGDLVLADRDGSHPKVFVEGFLPIDYDWSPDGQWIVYAAYDGDFNSDVWIRPIDGSRPPYNLSRHPRNDGSPRWSPDGKVIAFTGTRGADEVDIHFVFLREDDDQVSNRDKALKKAIDKMNKARKQGPATSGGNGKGQPELAIDFDRLHERVRRVTIPNSNEGDLLWSPDGKKLAFGGSVDGRRGTYTIDVPDDLKPKLLSTQTGSNARWLKSGQIVWLAGGLPASISGSGARPTAAPTATSPTRTRGADSTTPAPTEEGATVYRFEAFQEVDLPAKHAAVFDQAWRLMRDNFYDERLGNRDWSAVRKKYVAAAAAAPDIETLATVVNLMLGELNGSHLGFYPAGGRFPVPGAATAEAPTDRWRVTTAHLGVRFRHDHAGPGLKIRDVLPGGVADLKQNRLRAGEIILQIDGTTVAPTMDLTKVLNGRPDRDVRLLVQGADGQQREVTVRASSDAAARSLLYRKWVNDNRERVEDLSGGQLGYAHIDAMNMTSFYNFETDLFRAGAGKAGLVIDVRENGGGSTADHLLTALTQPVHALTLPRGGSELGYPHDRKVYATWNKPIVVLCNQNSFSNAEIFSHAIKALKRGQLVGVATAGGVISTGGTTVMDVGFLRMPFRGWFSVIDGRDMELNGAVPHFVIWPEPGQMPRGEDVQLDKAVEVLKAEVESERMRPRPTPRKASELFALPARPADPDGAGD